MSSLDVHFSSLTDDWATPQWLFDFLDAQYRFTVDVCAHANNAKCKSYFTYEQDGLKQRWVGICWMNPPYGSEIGKWVKKAYRSSLEGATVVCLLPARTDTNWFHDYVSRASELLFLKGRLRFNDQQVGAPFPSVVAVFLPSSNSGGGQVVRFVELKPIVLPAVSPVLERYDL